MKLYLSLLCLFFGTVVIANNEQILIDNKTVTLNLNKKDETATFMIFDGKNTRALTKKEQASFIVSIINGIKDSVCELTVKPQSVAGSIGPITLSWETKTLCGK